MRNQFPFIILFTIIFISGCKKTTPAFSGAKVTARYNLVTGDNETYTYNSSGNVGEIDRNSGGKSIFLYSGDTVLQENIIGGSVIASATKYLLQGDTYADTSFGLYQTQHNSTSYAYNGDGQLIEQKNYGYGALSSTSAFTYGNKNTTSVINSNISTNTTNYVYYSYGTKTNTIGNQNFGMGFLGVGTLYLPLTQVQISQTGDTTGIISYSYHFNSGSNVDTMTTHDRVGHLIDSMAYSY